jgi:hypothetical protein
MTNIPEDLTCPHCEYEHYDGTEIGRKRTKEGPFFILPVEAIQTPSDDQSILATRSVPVYFCPRCGFSFIQTRK